MSGTISLDSQGDGFGVTWQSRSPLVVVREQRGQGGPSWGVEVLQGQEQSPSGHPGRAQPRTEDRSRSPRPQQTARAPGIPRGWVARAMPSAGWALAEGLRGRGVRLRGCRASPPPRRKWCQPLTRAPTSGASSPRAALGSRGCCRPLRQRAAVRVKSALGSGDRPPSPTGFSPPYQRSSVSLIHAALHSLQRALAISLSVANI